MSVYNIDGIEVGNTFNVLGNGTSEVYDIDGNLLSGITPLPLDYSSYSTTDLFTYVANGFDGFDVYDGIIAQLMANDKLYLFDLETHTALKTAVSISSGHGASASFSTERYQTSDAMPLLYVSTDANPSTVTINRITENGTMLIRTLKFPTDKSGYYAGHAYDKANNIMYMVGYMQNSYVSSDSGNNQVIVSKWDMTELTPDGSGNYTPIFVSRYFRDFIYVMQGKQFFDGYIWIASGYNDGGMQYIYALNPANGTIEHTITLDDRVEVEGLAWVYDETENKYWLLIGQQNGASGINYSRIDFDTLNITGGVT